MAQQFWHDPLLPFVESRRCWQSRACYRPHTHPALSIGAVDAGYSLLQVEGQADQQLEAGDVVIIPARCVHACNPASDACWSYQMLYLDADWVAGLQQESRIESRGMQRRPLLHLRDPEYYRRYCDLNALLFGFSPAEVKEEALIDFVGSLLLDHPAETVEVPSWLPAMADNLDRNCEQDWPIARLATQAGVSRYHLIRMFRQHTGLTPHAYQLDCRINKARLMLREGMPLADLAVQLGFSDQSHFQRTFRERASVTPGDYQRKLRC